MTTTPQDRRAVFIGILCAWVLSAAFIGLGVSIGSQSGVMRDWTVFKALGFAVSLSGVPLVLGIAWAAQTRHFVSNVDGSRPATGSRLDILLRYVWNTTEQAVLFLIAAIGFGQAFPEFAPVFLPVMGCWFVIARLAFLFGYFFNPLARAFGFAATFHPTIALLFSALWKYMW